MNTHEASSDRQSNPDRNTLMFDVVIVGAGLVGSAMACALATDDAGQSLRIAVVEAGGEPNQFSGQTFDPRVVAVDTCFARFVGKCRRLAANSR